jgi:4-hydroxy-tetrahydrodipicolinate reductase
LLFGHKKLKEVKMKTKLAVVGAAGRMGRRIIALAVEGGQFDIIAAVEKPDHPDIGKDAGAVAGTGTLNVKVAGIYPDAPADAAIDFSQPQATVATVDYCLKNSAALVLGTTGLNDQQRDKIKTASKKIPILYATNMSVGMNVLFSLVGKVASMLGEEYDVEIIEQHHRFKKDAPSGSALTLAENISKATGRDFPACLVHGRSGKEALRQKDAIGMHAIRAGDITGIHSVIFGTLGETVTINHAAHTRDTFVRGSLRAAKWLVGKKPALYSMTDVLGIE